MVAISLRAPSPCQQFEGLLELFSIASLRQPRRIICPHLNSRRIVGADRNELRPDITCRLTRPLRLMIRAIGRRLQSIAIRDDDLLPRRADESSLLKIMQANCDARPSRPEQKIDERKINRLKPLACLLALPTSSFLFESKSHGVCSAHPEALALIATT